MDPTVLSNGRILFTRWDTAPGRNAMHLYTINPDGSDLQLHYGAVSHMTGSSNDEIQFTRTRQMPDGRLLSLVRAFDESDFGGDLYLINATVSSRTVNHSPRMAACRGRRSRRHGQRRSDDSWVSPGGRFSAAFPLWDGSNRIAVSWTQCRALLAGQVRACTNDVLSNPAVCLLSRSTASGCTTRSAMPSCR